MKKFTGIVLLMLLNACATDDVRGCRNVDWYSAGFEDAIYGKKVSRGVDRESTCKSLGFTYDNKSYRNGFHTGLRKFCKSESGFEFGAQGQIYQYTCPKSSEAQFLTGYWQGRRQFLKEEIQDKKGLIRSIASDIEEKRKRLIQLKGNPTEGDEKKMLTLDVTKLKERKKTVAAEITQLAEQLDGLEK